MTDQTRRRVHAAIIAVSLLIGAAALFEMLSGPPGPRLLFGGVLIGCVLVAAVALLLMPDRKDHP